MLSNIAARTSTIRLFSAITLLSILDPVRVAEDYATVDHLSDGRLEVIIGKGNGPEQAELFGLQREQQWATTSENDRLLRRLLDTEAATWSGPRRPDLVDAVTLPRPLQQPLRVWHGSATSRESIELAAEFGDPLFSADVANPIEPYAELVDSYRERWVHHGHDPARLYVGAGSGVRAGQGRHAVRRCPGHGGRSGLRCSPRRPAPTSCCSRRSPTTTPTAAC